MREPTIKEWHDLIKGMDVDAYTEELYSPLSESVKGYIVLPPTSDNINSEAAARLNYDIGKGMIKEEVV